MSHVLPSLQRLPFLSELALVTLMAWMISGWLMPQTGTQTSNRLNNIEIKAVVLPEINNMIAVKLFGQPPQQAKSAVVVAPRPKPIIMRPLSLRLLGTVVAGGDSAAIIALKKGADQRAFFIGDTIQAGVILQSVEANAIVVDRNGTLERISLEDGGKLRSRRLTTTITPKSGHSPTRAMTQTTNASMNRTMSRIHLQKQLENFPALLSQARATPHLVNGKMNGFSITNIVRGSLYQQAGLQDGDIIVSVNGQQITGAQQAMGIYNALKNSPALDIELIRAGVMQNIHYNIH